MRCSAIWVLVLVSGCVRNGLGAKAPPLTDPEVHQLVEEWLNRTHPTDRPGCMWAPESDSLPGVDTCLGSGGSPWVAKYDLRPGTAKVFTLSDRFIGYECRLNGRKPGSVGRLGCWMIWMY